MFLLWTNNSNLSSSNKCLRGSFLILYLAPLHVISVRKFNVTHLPYLSNSKTLLCFAVRQQTFSWKLERNTLLTNREIHYMSIFLFLLHDIVLKAIKFVLHWNHKAYIHHPRNEPPPRNEFQTYYKVIEIVIIQLD